MLNNTDEVEKNRKHKAREEVILRRKTTKYTQNNDDSLQAWCDYDRHDDVAGVHEIHQDVPGYHLQHLMMMDFYVANVNVLPAKALQVPHCKKGVVLLTKKVKPSL